MIRKLARIDAPIPLLREMFSNTDDWPRWMPGVIATRTLESSAERRLVEVIQLVHGHKLVQQLECLEVGKVLRQRQAAGWLKKWEAEWSFELPPEGGGTVLGLRLDFELGLLGLVIPRGPLRRWTHNQLDETFAKARARAELLETRQRTPTLAVELGKPLLQVYETPRGFEVCFAGRTFHIDAAERAGGQSVFSGRYYVEPLRR